MTPTSLLLEPGLPGFLITCPHCQREVLLDVRVSEPPPIKLPNDIFPDPTPPFDAPPAVPQAPVDFSERG